ncbi:MAG: diadenylate cyclase CdaA [Erysipelotrichaceae bacterium]|nr:diadenylate cyclase CdaA [Erysipelotrichaceae bacterium]
MPDYNINLTIQNIWTIFRVLIDIGIMWFVLYYAIKFVRNNSRTIQIFKGIIAIIAVNGIAKLLGLSTVAYFSDMFINWGFLAAIIIFQPEIRGLLERIGKSNAFSKINTLLANEREKLVEELYEATITLSKNRIGALISIEQSQSMQDYINTGISINAVVSKELLSSIFMTTTPLHDGAVIIQGDKVACASAYFPPTSVNLSSRYGARHRAALGISEVTDALTIVVSEETSNISIAENGRIFSVDEKQLKDYLRRVICNDEIEIARAGRQRTSLLLDDEEMIIEKENTDERKNIFSGLFRKKDEEEEVKSGNELDMKVPTNNRIKYEENLKEAEKESEAPSRVEEYVEDVVAIQDNTVSKEADHGEEE